MAARSIGNFDILPPLRSCLCSRGGVSALFRRAGKWRTVLSTLPLRYNVIAVSLRSESSLNLSQTWTLVVL